MKVNSNRDISFKSLYTNSTLKKGLEFAADNGALFGAVTTLVLSTVARPASIWFTPSIDKDNKNTLVAKYLSSALTGFLIMLGISTPISKSIKKINNNPEKYLKKETISNLTEKGKGFINSDSYKFATQMFKLGISTAVAIPKAIITAMFISPLINVFHNKKDKQDSLEQVSQVNFKGKRLAGKIGNIIDNNNFQNFAKKYKDTNFPMHIIALTDALTTATFATTVLKNESFEKKQKNTLISNAVLSTLMSIGAGYIIDKLLDKPTEKLITKYREANKGMPNIEKQVEGIKIAKPILIVGSIYYIAIPIISALLSDKIQLYKNFDNKIL